LLPPIERNPVLSLKMSIKRSEIIAREEQRERKEPQKERQHLVGDLTTGEEE